MMNVANGSGCPTPGVLIALKPREQAMDNSLMEPLIERIEHLEEENRQLTKQLHLLRQEHRLWRRAGSLVAIGVLVLVCAAPTFQPPGPLVGTKLALVDPRNPDIQRFQMFTERDAAILRICRSNGRPQIELVVRDRDLPYIYLKDPEGNILRRFP
jgi:hypothetical protein